MTISERVRPLNETFDEDSEYVPQLPIKERPEYKWTRKDRLKFAHLLLNHGFRLAYMFAPVVILVVFVKIGSDILNGEAENPFNESQIAGFLLMLIGIMFYFILRRK